MQEARDLALGRVTSMPTPDTQRSAENWQIVQDSEAVGFIVVDGKATPVYQALLLNSDAPNSRPQKIEIPLTQQ